VAVASADNPAGFLLRRTASTTAFAVAHCCMKNISRAADRLFAAFFCWHRIHRSDNARAIAGNRFAIAAVRRKIRRKLFLQNS
jgi:hypothetical protein